MGIHEQMKDWDKRIGVPDSIKIDADAEEKGYQEWKAELIRITAKEAKIPESSIKINDSEARSWYLSGISAYYCFRETFTQ